MAAQQVNYVYFGKIINVVDGDTVDMEVDLGFYVKVGERFRLSFINAAEMNSSDKEERALAIEALSWLSAFKGLPVRVKSTKKDKYGRFLAEIFVEGDPVSLNQKLLDRGLAVPYK